MFRLTRVSIKTSTCADTSYTATFKFHCPPERIFEALTDVRDVMRYTQSPGVKIEAKPGGVYSIFEGSIQGEFVEATPELIVLKWRLKNWEAGCFSKVVIRCTRRGAIGCDRNLLDERWLAVNSSTRRAVPRAFQKHAFKPLALATRHQTPLAIAGCRISPHNSLGGGGLGRAGDDSTVVTLEHTDIPLTDAHGHGDQAKQAERGWRERIFLAMSR